MNDDKNKTAPIAAATAEGQSNVTNTVSIAEEPPNRNRKVKGPSRMISEAIICSGRFLKLSDKAKVLYMYLMVRTDDEGAVEAYPARVLIGAGQEVLDELISKRFVIRLNEDDVVLVKDFFEQNTLRADRTKPSRFHNLIADISPQNAANGQPNINQSNPIKPNIREVNTTQSKSVQDVTDGFAEEEDYYHVYNPKEEYVIPYVMDRFGYKHGLSEGDIRHLVEMADMLESVPRETEHDPDGSGYEWMQEYLGPNMSEGDRELLFSLTDKYHIDRSRIRPSKFTDVNTFVLSSGMNVFRNAIEKSKKDFESDDIMCNFPYGCSKDASILLANYFFLNYGKTSINVIGTSGVNTHSWLEIDGIIYDITADQYDYTSGYCGKYDSFYNSFSFTNVPTSGIGRISNNEQERLQRLYNTISANIVDQIK